MGDAAGDVTLDARGGGGWWSHLDAGGCSGRDGGGRWSRLDVGGSGVVAARWPVTWPSRVGMREGGELVEMAVTPALSCV